MKGKQLEVCPKHVNQLEKINLILSNGNICCTFVQGETQPQPVKLYLTYLITKQEIRIILLIETHVWDCLSRDRALLTSSELQNNV